MAPARVVIVGAGQAGFQAAALLRQDGFDGSITLVGEEPGWPYQRPPLSKDYLKGTADEEVLPLRGESFYAHHEIDVRASTHVAEIDREAARIRLDSGDFLPYDHLILATGARNRTLPLPGSDLTGVMALRSVADARALREALGEAERAVVVGAGFIGLEFAAAARFLGVDVVVLEALPRAMTRAVSIETARFLTAAHSQQGVTFHFGATVRGILGADGRVVAVQTDGGKRFPADLVLLSVGVVPNTELAAAAGLPVQNGIVVDEQLSTPDSAISAVGDCASYPSRYGDPLVRLESVQNAVDSARCVAARLVGRPAPYADVPWFWSDQGELRLQIAGVTSGYDLAVVSGNPASGSFSVFCFGRGTLLGVESVGRPRDHMAARRLLAEGLSLTPDEAARPAFDLKAYVEAARERASHEL